MSSNNVVMHPYSSAYTKRIFVIHVNTREDTGTYEINPPKKNSRHTAYIYQLAPTQKTATE